MTGSQYVKYGVLSGLLLLCAIMVSMNGDKQNSAFAQITPAAGNVATDESSPNSSTDNNGGDGSTGSSSSNNDNDKQGTTSTEQEGTAEEKENNDGHGEGITPTPSNNMNRITTDRVQQKNIITTDIITRQDSKTKQLRNKMLMMMGRIQEKNRMLIQTTNRQTH
mgnify:CR=1 FL=1